jgi:hypothetical protein
MKYFIARGLRITCPDLCLVLACLLTPLIHAQSANGVQSAPAATPVEAMQRVITLEPPTGWDLQVHAFDVHGNALPGAPATFRRLGEVKVGDVGEVHALTLRFAETVKLTSIKSTPDFRIERGGSCVEGGIYAANASCTVLVRFTPKGPGHRLGHLLISHAGSGAVANSASTSGSQLASGSVTQSGSGVQLAAFGLGGVSYEPVISFIPSIITTVPSSYPSKVGLFNAAHNLAVDGGDTLWIADTGNNLIRQMDSSGTFVTLASGFSAPWGIAVDTFGQAYFDRPASNTMNEIYDYGPVVQVNGTGTGSCPVSAPCTLSSHAITNPGELSIDSYNNLFFAEQTSGAALSTVQPTPADLIFLYDPFPYQTNPISAFAVDANDNLYSLWANGGTCEIVQQSLYNAEHSNAAFNKVAGGHTCGFSGDGGLGGSAQIGNVAGQFAFDAAGNMYFSDTQNQRVRRIDYNTGIIRTIAGNGTAGYTGDGSRATFATLNNPTGVGVDSQGGVYIISNSAATGSAQVLRKVGPQGFVVFGNQSKGTASAPQFVTVSNTGNAYMLLTNVAIAGANATDFKIDSTTTTCMLTPGASLPNGQTCKIGIIFTPSATGARQATLTLLDNTVNGADTVTLSGSGILPSPIFKITSPASGASFTSGAAVTFSVSVTSSSGPQPTGTAQFKVDGANFGSAVTLSSTGTASTNVTGLTTTTHTLSATYSGNANYAAAGPISVSITVTAALKVASLVSLSTTSTAASTCSLPQFAVTVSGASGPVPTGEVKLLDGTKQLTSGSLTKGKALLSAHPLRAGMHKLTASYSGDGFHIPAASLAVRELVSPLGCTAP